MLGFLRKLVSPCLLLVLAGRLALWDRETKAGTLALTSRHVELNDAYAKPIVVEPATPTPVEVDPMPMALFLANLIETDDGVRFEALPIQKGLGVDPMEDRYSDFPVLFPVLFPAICWDPIIILYVDENGFVRERLENLCFESETDTPIIPEPSAIVLALGGIFLLIAKRRTGRWDRQPMGASAPL